MVGVIGARTCDHVVEYGDAFVCYRCASNGPGEGIVLPNGTINRQAVKAVNDERGRSTLPRDS